jgi:hypothetical protein
VVILFDTLAVLFCCVPKATANNIFAMSVVVDGKMKNVRHLLASWLARAQQPYYIINDSGVRLSVGRLQYKTEVKYD